MKTYSIPRHIWRALWPVLAFLGAQLAVSILFTGVAMLTSSDPDAAIVFATENSLLIILCSDIVGLAVFLPLWLRTKKTHAALNSGTLKPATIALTLLMFIGVSLVISSLLLGTPILEFFPSTESVAAALSGSFLLQVITIGLLSPVVEELCLRGVVLNRLSTWMPAWAAVLVSSIVFGLIHMNAFQTINTTMLGLLFGFVYVRTRNIAIPLVAHVANNMMSVLLDPLLGIVGVDLPYGVIAAISFVVAAACAVLIHRSTRSQPKAGPLYRFLDSKNQ